jgi:hypothetical protein
MPKRETGVDSAVEAIDKYVSTLLLYVDLAPSRNGDTDLNAADDELRATFADAAGIDLIITEAREKVDQTLERAQRSGFGDLSTRMAANALGGIWFSLYELVEGTDPQLQAARDALGVAENALEGCRQEMELAIEAGDIDKVLVLRNSLEIVVPAAAASARLKVLDLEVQHADRLAERPVALAAAASAKVASAEAAFRMAQEALKTTQEDVRVAQNTAALPESAARTASAQLQRLKAERDAAQGAAELDQRERLRALASLPPSRTVETAEPTDLQPWRVLVGEPIPGLS